MTESPPPLEANDRLVTAAGTAAWAVALLVVALVPGIPRWWIWTCATGLAMGLFGLWYVPRLKRSRAPTAAARTATAPPADDDTGSAGSIGSAG